MADLYGYRIDNYINGLPDGDEYKTLFTTMDRHHSCPVDSVISMIQEFKSKGGLETQTLLGIITVEQGDSIAGMEMIRNAAERECSIAEILLYGPNWSTDRHSKTPLDSKPSSLT